MQIGIAVTAGQLLHLLPGQVVQAVTAGLFVAGSAYLWVTSFRPQELEGADAAREGGGPDSFWRVAAASFGLIFLAEFGDITQITAANLAARYGPVPVFAGASLGLWGHRRRRRHRGRQEPAAAPAALDPPTHRDDPARLRLLRHRRRDHR